MNPYSPDHYANKARKDGFAARSVYKLQEIHKKYLRDIHNYTHVLDLGAAPGSWSQYLQRHISKKGTIIAVDTKELNTEVRALPQIEYIRADFTDSSCIDLLVSKGPFDLILSDAAPHTSGHKSLDSARSELLVESCIQIAERSLKAQGVLVAKLFQGENSQGIFSELQSKFSSVHRARPKAVKSSSFELYVVCS